MEHAPLVSGGLAPDGGARPLGGRFLGPYRLVRQLGEGGFAPVWLAEEVYEGKPLREVAVKLFFPPASVSTSSPEVAAWRERIIEEARSLCRVEHPSIVRFYSLQRDDEAELIGLVMEHVAGKSLDKRLDQRGPLDEKATLEVAIAVAWALAAVHEAGLVHRDVKPANIVESRSGYRLIDFGIAAAMPPVSAPQEPAGGVTIVTRQKVESPRATDKTEIAVGVDPGLAVGDTTVISPAPGGPRAGDTTVISSAPPGSPRADAATTGTLGYISPECFANGAPATPASDLYALGVTLFMLLTKTMPAIAASMVAKRASWSFNVLLGTAEPPRLDAVMERPPCKALVDLTALLLRPDPRERPHHADWVARELEAVRARLFPASASELEPSLTESAIRAHPGRAQRRRSPSIERAPPLVGRDDVLALIAREAAAASQRGVRSIVVTGPMGIGRTRLVEAAALQSAGAFARILRLKGSPERRGPLRPLLRAIEAAQGPRAAAEGPLRDAIDRALSPGALGGPSELTEALEGVESALLASSDEAPTLLVFDDLQWADEHSLTLLRMLVSRAGVGTSGRMLVLSASRNEPDAPAPLEAFLSGAREHHSNAVHFIPLGPLTTDEARRLARSVAPLSPELERAVIRGSGNVPFFVVHSLLVWHEKGLLELREGLWHPASERSLQGEVPGVADLVEARLASCFEPESLEDRSAQRVLACIALYGGGLGVELLVRVCTDEAAVRDALGALLDAGLLSLDGEREYAFAQEMVRQALLNLTRRRPWFHRLHHELLDAIADRPSAAEDAAFLAWGYEKLGVRKPARKWLRKAMEAAIGAGLFGAAAELGDRLFTVAADAAERAALELEIVRALIDGRKFEDARRRLELLDVRADSLALAPGGKAIDLRRRIYRLYVSRGTHAAAPVDATLVEEADALGDMTLRCEARMAAAGVQRDDPAMKLAGEAVELSTRLGETMEFYARMLRLEIAYASSHRDFLLMEQDLRRALAIAAAVASAWKQIAIEGDLAILEAEMGQLDAAIERFRRLVQKAETQGMQGNVRLFLQNLSAFLLRAGRADEAAEVAHRTTRLAEQAGDPVLRATSLSLRADALRRTGLLEPALESANEAVSLQESRGDPMVALTLLRRAEILEALGRQDEALGDAREAHRVAADRGDRDLATRALLWETLQRARKGEATAEEMSAILGRADCSEDTFRAPTRSLLVEAQRWMDSSR
jgi:serine/threonine protein kinase/tetratricopeptide (TPR) repeat protein